MRLIQTSRSILVSDEAEAAIQAARAVLAKLERAYCRSKTPAEQASNLAATRAQRQFVLNLVAQAQEEA